MGIAKCSRSMVFNMSKMEKNKEDISMKAKSGEHNLKKDSEFLYSLATKILEDPSKMMNCLLNNICVSAKPIRRALKADLGLSS
uniref:Uncharacterized protein n=1 Tax=Lepeophtheirus salmonis TaxID=72036 RepID=A0A0K2TG39_LEPSM